MIRILVSTFVAALLGSAFGAPSETLRSADLIVAGEVVETMPAGDKAVGVRLKIHSTIAGPQLGDIWLLIPRIAIWPPEPSPGPRTGGNGVLNVDLGSKAVWFLQQRGPEGFDRNRGDKMGKWDDRGFEWAPISAYGFGDEQIPITETEFDTKLAGPMLRLADLMLRNAQLKTPNFRRHLTEIKDCSPDRMKVDGDPDGQLLPGEDRKASEAWFRAEFDKRWCARDLREQAMGLAVAAYWLDDESVEDQFVDAYLACQDTYDLYVMPSIRRKSNQARIAEFAPPGIAGSYIGTDAFLKDEGTKRHLLRIALARLGESAFLDSRICEAVATAFNKPEIRPDQPYQLSKDLDLTANKEALRRLAEELGMGT